MHPHSPTAPPTLLVGALHAEVIPLLRRLQDRHRLGPGLHAGALAGHRVLIQRCGVGRRRAERATAAVMAAHAVGTVASIGTCGSLVDGLGVGTLVTAGSILGCDGRRLQAQASVGRAVCVATVPRVVADPEHRARWASRGAEVCEMEAAGVLDASEGHPFVALKIVSDLAGARPPKLRGLPLWARIAAFQIRAYRLVDRRLAPALEAWLRTERRSD